MLCYILLYILYYIPCPLRAIDTCQIEQHRLGCQMPMCRIDQHMHMSQLPTPKKHRGFESVRNVNWSGNYVPLSYIPTIRLGTISPVGYTYKINDPSRKGSTVLRKTAG